MMNNIRNDPENDEEFFRLLGISDHDDDPNEIVERDRFQARARRIRKKNKNVHRLNPAGSVVCEECGSDLEMIRGKLSCSNSLCITRKAKSRYQILLDEAKEDEV